MLTKVAVTCSRHQYGNWFLLGTILQSQDDSRCLLAQGYSAYQTVTANNNGQVTTTPTTSGAGNTGQYSSNTQQNGNQISSTYGQGGTSGYNTQQGGANSNPNGQTNQL